MRAWPVELAAKYPLPPGRSQDRPWWDGQRRSDGLILRYYHTPGRFVLPIQQQGDTVEFDIGLVNKEWAQKAWDQVKPIPHPGFRVGQVWAKLDPDYKDPVVLVVVEYSDKWYLGGSKIGTTQEELETLLQNAFLLTDTVCPWLAPWAPCVLGEDPK